jgi:Rrf2 family protein
LASTRGKHGGFRLGQPADRLSLYAVVNRFDRIEARRSCLLGRAECSDRQACLVHWRWKSLSEQVTRFFQDTTVAELVSGAAAHPQHTRRVVND